jgi:hypothetical protein
MRTKVIATSPEVELARILKGLEQELIDATDEEIIEAAKDLGMNPKMKGSAAFAGLTFPAKPQLSDFFEFETRENMRVSVEPAADATGGSPELKTLEPRPFEIPTEDEDFPR